MEHGCRRKRGRYFVNFASSWLTATCWWRVGRRRPFQVARRSVLRSSATSVLGASRRRLSVPRSPAPAPHEISVVRSPRRRRRPLGDLSRLACVGSLCCDGLRLHPTGRWSRPRDARVALLLARMNHSEVHRHRRPWKGCVSGSGQAAVIGDLASSYAASGRRAGLVSRRNRKVRISLAGIE